MKIAKATSRYETWLGGHLRLVRKDLNLKHERMAQDAFPFFRATFYRWAQLFPEHEGDLLKAPRVLGVGDLHAENFGTWRDAEGRLVWGINDFDEACRIPFTNDLVRLAASLILAQADAKLAVGQHDAADALLGGYTDALAHGGRAVVLAEHHPALWAMAVHRLHAPETWWDKLNQCRAVRAIPKGAAKALTRALPDQTLKVRVVHRVAGLGSLGRERYVAIADWHGGQVAREAKALAPSAWSWAQPKAGSRLLYKECVARAVRCGDPFLSVSRRWITRRLAPDCSRIELGQLPKERDESRLLHAMGWETANVHLGSQSAKALRADLRRRPKAWLAEAAERMAGVMGQEWKAWRG
ncbi:MAG TPA: DUF2252 family protein [Gemmatimonadales bacterium]|jgi:uncharacterized protein (DUF2252 family)